MRISDPIWHCSRNSPDGADIITYSNPKKYITKLGYLTVQPASGYTDTVQFGENVSKVWNIIANRKIFKGIFKEGDLLYVDGLKPGSNTMNGKGANALITSVREQNFFIRITIEKITG